MTEPEVSGIGPDRRCGRAPYATATTGSSTVTSGSRPARRARRSGSSWRSPTRTRSRTRARRRSSSRRTRPAWRSFAPFRRWGTAAAAGRRTVRCVTRASAFPSRTRSARWETGSGSRRSASGRAASTTSCAGSVRCNVRSSSCATYALERETFGGPLADKQTVQNWIADSAAEIQACRLMTLDAAHKIDQG